MSVMSIKELEEIIKAAPNKELPIHYLGNNGGLKFELVEARLEDKALLLIEGDEIPVQETKDDEDDE